MLSDAELLRYSRQIMLPEFDIAAQEKLKAARVLIVGLGGIGSPVALYLAAAGVGELVLADYDTVDASNLQRQIVHREATIGWSKTQSATATLQALNAATKIRSLSAPLNGDNLPALLESVDIVVDGCDNFITRDAVNTACVALSKPLISAAAIGLSAQLAVFDSRQATSPCYRCLYPQADDVAATCSESGVLASVVGVMGTLQAHEALKCLSGIGEVLYGRLLLWEADMLTWRTLKFSKDPNCPVCGNVNNEVM